MKAENAQTEVVVTFPTQLGWFGAIVAPAGLKRLQFGHQTEDDVRNELDTQHIGTSDSLPPWWMNAQNLLVDYAAGDFVELGEIPVAFSKRTLFQQRVMRELQQVRYGERITYAELAARAGSPGAARAVGNLMAKNLVPLVIPCHRVVASAGKLGGFSAPQGVDMKRRLLQMERKVDLQLCTGLACRELT